MRNQFDEQLELLNRELIEMGALVEAAIDNALKALTERDIALAGRAIELDREVDRKEQDIESMLLRLLLQQQPVARDLRFISAAMRMITDMERIGDHATDISEITIMLSDMPYTPLIEHIPDMAAAAKKMLGGSVDAFVRRDLQLARSVIDYDDVVDDYFNKVKADLIRMIEEKAAGGEQAIDFMMIAKYLERIGDHAQNIAEWVVFSITGERVNSERGEA